MMQIGDKAPEVWGMDENGNEIRLDRFRGRKVILYFYPKDSTPGCTAEACSLRDSYAKLHKLGYDVVGVSIDSAASHLRFKEKNELPFTLVADTDKQLVNRMGVFGEKKMAGRTYMGTYRTTFVLDESGVIERIFLPKEIKTKTHAEQLLDYITKG